MAIARAPFVENGETSTAEDETERAAMSIVALTRAGSPVVVTRNGTESGMSAPRMPVVEANAETTAPTNKMMTTAIFGVPRPAAIPPTHSMIPWRSSIETYVTMPPTSRIVGHAIWVREPFAEFG